MSGRINSYSKLKGKALSLRRTGLSYSEIRSRVAVSKSTLSLWLHGIELAKEHRERLKNKIGISQPLAAKAHRDERIRRTKEIVERAKSEIGEISRKDLFYFGNALYWAEGSKQKEHNRGQRVTFNNSDPMMIKIYLRWLFECLDIKKAQIDFEIYSHENIREKEKGVVKYWSETTGFPELSFRKIYYKSDKKKKYRKNQGESYYGLLRVVVLKSTDLNRKIAGWIEGICFQCGVV
jgi:hypothetical protein